MISLSIPLPVSDSELKGQDVIFDMDGTLIQGDLGETVFLLSLIHHSSGSSQRVFAEGGPHRTGSPVILAGEAADTLFQYLAMIGQGEMEGAYALTARWIAEQQGWDPGTMAREVLEQDLPPGILHMRLIHEGQEVCFTPRYGARFLPFMRELAGQILQAGASGWIVSASPQPVCEAVGNLLGFSPSQIIGVEWEQGGLRTPWGKQKVIELQRKGVSAPLLAFGDSAGDVALLSFARHGVLVNTSREPELLRQAHQQGWMILQDDPYEKKSGEST